jgi:hypothetical protein
VAVKIKGEPFNATIRLFFSRMSLAGASFVDKALSNRAWRLSVGSSKAVPSSLPDERILVLLMSKTG